MKELVETIVKSLVDNEEDVRVKQVDGENAWSSPIWINQN